VDRAVPEIHHAMTAARAKPQVTGPDELSAPTGSSLVGDREQHVSVAGLIERAVTREVASPQLSFDIVDRDGQPTCE
jgi:hypothetical protein